MFKRLISFLIAFSLLVFSASANAKITNEKTYKYWTSGLVQDRDITIARMSTAKSGVGLILDLYSKNFLISLVTVNRAKLRSDGKTYTVGINIQVDDNKVYSTFGDMSIANGFLWIHIKKGLDNKILQEAKKGKVISLIVNFPKKPLNLIYPLDGFNEALYRAHVLFKENAKKDLEYFNFD